MFRVVVLALLSASNRFSSKICTVISSIRVPANSNPQKLDLSVGLFYKTFLRAGFTSSLILLDLLFFFFPILLTCTLNIDTSKYGRETLRSPWGRADSAAGFIMQTLFEQTVILLSVFWRMEMCMSE